jgi:hypothetical protein
MPQKTHDVADFVFLATPQGTGWQRPAATRRTVPVSPAVTG